MYDMSTIPPPFVRSHGELRGLLAHLGVTGRMVKAEASCSDALVSSVLHGKRQSKRVAHALARLVRHPRWTPDEAKAVAKQIRALCFPLPRTKTPAAARRGGEATRGRPAEPSASGEGRCQPDTPPRGVTRKPRPEVSAAEGAR